jgi:hypothetical protein
MNTKNLLWGKVRLTGNDDNLAAICELAFMNLWETRRPTNHMGLHGVFLSFYKQSKLHFA